MVQQRLTHTTYLRQANIDRRQSGPANFTGLRRTDSQLNWIRCPLAISQTSGEGMTEKAPRVRTRHARGPWELRRKHSGSSACKNRNMQHMTNEISRSHLINCEQRCANPERAPVTTARAKSFQSTHPRIYTRRTYTQRHCYIRRLLHFRGRKQILHALYQHARTN